MDGPAVEVRKNPKSTTWYNATILDIVGENITVGFEDNIWQAREVPALSVRRCPRDTVSDDFDPQEGELVEVSVSASEANPSGWSSGKIKTIKNSFYFISFVGSVGAKQDLIVERNALRRVNTEPPIEAAKLERKLIPIEPALHSWVRSPDSPGCLNHVQSKARLLLCHCTNLASDQSPEVLLIGDRRAIDLGEMLLTHIHFKNQVEMQRFHEQRELLMARLQEQQRWYNERNQEVFVVEQQLVGKIIGKKGEHINAIREKFDVDIHLSPPYAQDDEPTTVTVTGETLEQCRNAREELEYITDKIPIDTNQVGWILGKGYQNIQDIAKKSEVHYARFDDKTSSIELCGLKRQVEEAKMLISHHREYHPVYQDMDEDQSAIQQAFEELDGAAGGKPKGKGKTGKSGSKDGWRDDKGKDGWRDDKGGWKDEKGGWKGEKGDKGKGEKGDKNKGEKGDKSKGDKGKGDKGKGEKGKSDKGKGKNSMAEVDDEESYPSLSKGRERGRGRRGGRKGS